MTPPSPSLERRAFVRAAGAVAIGASVAGCLGTWGDGNDAVVLDEPDGYERAKDAAVAWPIYGESLPEATVHAPLHDRTVTSTEFVGERHALFTFIFTRCPGACPGLMAALRHVQDDSIERGYEDEVVFMPITFDPEHDTADVLATYEETYGVDRGAENWYTLRPTSHEDAKEVVEETFGCGFERMEVADEDGHGDHDEGDGHGDHDGHDMEFMHATLLILANKDGYVERAYAGEVPNPSVVVDDTRTVVEEW